MKFSDLQKLKETPPPARTPVPTPASAPPPAAATAEKLPPAAAPRFPISLDKEAPAPAAIPLLKPSDTGRTRPVPAPEAPFAELDAKARKTYARLLAQAATFLQRTSQPYTEQYRAVSSVCADTAAVLKVNPVLLNYAAYSTSGGYLPGHSANTVLLSLAMGLSMGLEDSELNLLGFCAMASDIGMQDFEPLYSSSGRLSNEDYAQLTLHAEQAAAKLDCIVDLDHKVKARAEQIILQSHERADGSGYPKKLPAGEIDPLAQVIGIADVYEALTHPRSWREAMPAPEAIRELIDREGRSFNARIVKHLIGVLSIYPPGSLVLLSTGELARVIKVNKGSLTRPLVRIIAGPDLEEASPAELDLFRHPLTSIERSVTTAEIEKRNPSLAGKLELARWWTD